MGRTKDDWITVQTKDFRDFSDRLNSFREDIVKCIPKDVKLLDIGCGNGYFLKFLKENGYTDIQGIDVVKAAVTETNNRGVKAWVMDAHTTDFADCLFDVVTASHVLEHSPFPRVVLREIKRILKPGGIAYIEVPIETFIQDGSAHFYHWSETSEFIRFIESEFEYLRGNFPGWFWVKVRKNDALHYPKG